MAADHLLSKAEFDEIYSKVPRLTVEIIIRNDAGELYLTRRDVEPCAGQWNIPGGTVRYGEPMLEAESAIQKGYIECPSHYLNGMDSPVGIVFEVTAYTGTIARDAESSDSGWFSHLPKTTHADQDTYLLERGYLKP